VPVDHKVFQQSNDAQMLWYQIQVALDDKDQFEILRDVAEHNAMFMNPEGVQQVRDARENTYETPEDEFNDMLKDTFGRDIPEVPENERVSFKDILEQQRKDKRVDPYLEMELDEVSFIPLK